MSPKPCSATLGSAGGASREVRVVSPTDVQAGGAARPRIRDGKSILEFRETLDDPQRS